MTQLIAINADALESLLAEVSRLHKRLDAVDMTPKPEWLTIADYADLIGKNRRTVIRRIDAGKLEARTIGGERMVRFNPDV